MKSRSSRLCWGVWSWTGRLDWRRRVTATTTATTAVPWWTTTAGPGPGPGKVGRGRWRTGVATPGGLEGAGTRSSTTAPRRVVGGPGATFVLRPCPRRGRKMTVRHAWSRHGARVAAATRRSTARPRRGCRRHHCRWPHYELLLHHHHHHHRHVQPAWWPEEA